MHLVILAHLSIFWVVCHPSRTFLLKELERKPQKRLFPSPHHQTILSFTFDPWPITLVLARKKWVVPSLVHTPLPFMSMACFLFMHSPWPGGLSGFCYTFCYSFLTSCGVDESLDFHSLYLASSLAWVLLRHEPFLLQSNLYPFYTAYSTIVRLGLVLTLFWASLAHFIALGLPWPILWVL